MSDTPPGPDELPDYLTQAILARGPAVDAVDLVKNAFSWRSIDAELLDLAFDSAFESAGVRDPDLGRSIEFSTDDVSLLLEVESGTLRGRVLPAETGTVQLTGLLIEREVQIGPDGRFDFGEVASGPVRLVFVGSSRLVTPTFSI